ncbi:MAG: tandem-95 repeat protein, partial [Hyphomicrobium sp.]
VAGSDVDGDTLSYAVTTGPTRGSVSLNAATGAYTYTPSANANGSDSFAVTVSDGNGGTAVQTISVTIAAVNDAPTVAATASRSTNEDTAVTGTVAGSDVDGDTLSYAVTTGPTRGSVSLNAATGAYTYTPSANVSGTDSFIVTVSDGRGGTAQQTISVAVAAIVDAPTLSVISPVITPTGATSGVFGASPSGTVIVAVEVSAALQDLDGSETLSILFSNVPSSGVFSNGVNNGNGTWSMTTADLSGLTLTASATDDFTITVTATSTESSGATTSSSASILIDLQAAESSYSGFGAGETINGTAGRDRLSGSGGADTIYGNDGADWISGGNGSDRLYGGNGNDLLFGGGGSDTFYSDAGNDVYNGGSGTDTLTYAAAASGVTINLARKVIYGSSTGVDAIDGTMEIVIGSNFSDTFTGSSSVDTYNAGGGNDWIQSGLGADVLTGGSGSDTFFWRTTEVGSAGVDRITDFSTGDMLDFRSLFTLGSGALSDFVSIRDIGSDMTVSARVNGTFVDVVTLVGVQNKTIAQLYADGQLLIA